MIFVVQNKWLSHFLLFGSLVFKLPEVAQHLNAAGKYDPVWLRYLPRTNRDRRRRTNLLLSDYGLLKFGGEC